MQRKILVLNDRDNVGVLLESAEKGDRCMYMDRPIEVMESIEFAHKIAIVDIPEKDWVIKYGEPIGYAITNIKKGQWIHTHNMACDRGKQKEAF